MHEIGEEAQMAGKICNSPSAFQRSIAALLFGLDILVSSAASAVLVSRQWR